MRNTRIQTSNNILPQGFHTFEVYSILLFDMQYCNQGINGPFAAEQSRGTKWPYWRANDALGHVKESHQI